MRGYLNMCLKIIGVAALLYFTPLTIHVLDFYVFKTGLLAQAPPWVESAYRTLYKPIVGGCKGPS